MKVLIISGDKHFKPGNSRYDLQASGADLTVLYWGRGALFPRIPTGHFDVVTVQDPFFRGLFGLYVAKKLKVRFNVQIHTDLSAQSLFKNFIARIVLHRADSIRAVSQKIKNTVEKYHTRAPITVLPVYIDVSRYRSIERKPEGNTILWMGRFEPEKDPFFALDVLRDVCKRIEGVRLVMLGTGSLAPLLHKTAQSLPVEFPGWQDPIPYLASAGVVINTSHFEGFSAAMAEALAARVPVVTENVSGAAEMGATIVSREHFPGTITRILSDKVPGQLAITLPTSEQWLTQWVQTL